MSLTKDQIREIARANADARWRKYRENQENLPVKKSNKIDMNKDLLIRDDNIFMDIISGETFKSVASKHNLSEHGIRKIVHKTARTISDPNLLNGKDLKWDSGHYYLEIDQLRKYKTFWLLQLTKFRNELGYYEP